MKIHEDRRQALQVSRYPRQEKLALAASLALWCQSKQQAFKSELEHEKVGQAVSARTYVGVDRASSIYVGT